MKVLIADDNEGSLIMLENILNKIDGIEIVGKAKDGEEEISLIKQFQPEIVFTDNDMPNLNGIEVIARIQEELKENSPAFYIVSGANSGELMKKIRELKVEGLIAKPYEEDRIEMVIQSYVSLKTRNNNANNSHRKEKTGLLSKLKKIFK